MFFVEKWIDLGYNILVMRISIPQNMAVLRGGGD